MELHLSPRIVDLASEQLDAAIRIGRLPDSALVARRLGSLTRKLFAAPAYLQTAGMPTSPAELPQHICVRLQ
ncbi:LysR substrate-binding domain-containing protein, partial [Enterobacter hormaechei]|uniref:LysR substrate-binding domain-containing protein n=1 Tax=Enterobacter hormaechei TaxID=158836 RepID=UPI001EF95CDE